MNEFSLHLTLREFIHMPVSYSTSVTIKSPSSYSKDPRFKSDDRLSRSSSIPLLLFIDTKFMSSLQCVSVLFFGRVTT